jgi:hypothetical protein
MNMPESRTFVSCLKEREETEATEEMLQIPGFLDEFQEAAQQLKDGDTVRFSDIRRQNVCVSPT